MPKGIPRNGFKAGGLTRARLQRLQAFHADRAKAIALVLAMVDDDISERKAGQFALGDDDAGPGAAIEQAIAMRKQAKHAKPAPNGKPTRSTYSAEAVRLRRQRTAEFLQRFSANEARPADPRQPGSAGLSALTARGYLKRTKAGEYIRTGKEFTP